MMLHRHKAHNEMSSLSTSGKWRKHFSTSEKAFLIVCQKLDDDGGLHPSWCVSVEGEKMVWGIVSLGFIVGLH